ncbi:MAG TPA: hypothetical protein VIR31_02295 [Nitrososphaeraceae archaeon]
MENEELQLQTWECDEDYSNDREEGDYCPDCGGVLIETSEDRDGGHFEIWRHCSKCSYEEYGGMH